MVSLMALFTSLYFIYSLISRVFSKNLALVTICFLSISPYISTLWWYKPEDCLILLVTVALINLATQKKWLWALVLVILLIINIFKYADASPLVRVFDLKSLGMNVDKRVLQEDSLTYRNELPIIVRRLGYNKPIFLVNRFLREVNAFFDTDSWFFAEIHPSNNKTMVMLFWPMFFLFMIGMYKVVSMNRSQIMFVSGWWILALSYFLGKSGQVSERFLIGLVPLMLMASFGFETKKNWWNILMLVFVTYGFISNWNDMLRRKTYWFDNRPIAMEFLLKNIPKTDKNIMVTNLVAGGIEYCKYYLSKSVCESKVSFEGFDVSKGVIENGIYSGFIGEFVGKDFNNNFGDKWEQKISERGLRILKMYKIENTIANQYGDILIIAEK